MFLQKENKRSFNFPSKLPAPGYELACSQPHTYSKWVQSSHSVCDQLWVSGWNELLCKTDWGDGHKIMRQITRRDTCISSSTLPLHVILCQQEILRHPLSYDATNHRPASGTNTFWSVTVVTAFTWNQRSWNPFRCPKKHYLFFKLSSMRKPVATPDL